MVEDKKMKRVLIGIDSSNNLECSMVAAGPEKDMRQFYEKIHQLLEKHGIKVMHFNEIDKRILKTVCRTIADIINQSMRLSFVVFEHKKPMGEAHKKYFLDYVPEKFADYLKSFDGKNRLIHIHVHDDYRVSKIKDSSKIFIEKLIRKLSRKISRKGIGIKIIENGKDDFVSSKIISKNGNYMKIRICCKYQNHSMPVNVADFCLGFYRNYQKLVKRKIKYKRI